MHVSQVICRGPFPIQSLASAEQVAAPVCGGASVWRRQCMAAAVYAVETWLLWDCIKHRTQQSWLLWIIQSSVVALMKAILHSPRAFIFPAQMHSLPFSATSSLLCPPFLSPPPLSLSHLSSPLTPSLPPSSPPHLPPALPPPTLLSNPGQQVYKVVLSVPPAAIPGGQSGKQTQPVPAAWLTERQRPRETERETEEEEEEGNY